ncbi:hypothetical protein E2562_022377 [Oryza meyeriana var. granulata]|uniref:Uncharacterized protein n=1 Tax=Oryza meyeriana var. granulata TaxID=110450 RepID=A0A6G1DKX6_9ORYZ|nr:hypothetical protein E2562_022377 [Oryza meyeriana var. granulata]
MKLLSLLWLRCPCPVPLHVAAIAASANEEAEDARSDDPGLPAGGSGWPERRQAGVAWGPQGEAATSGRRRRMG